MATQLLLWPINNSISSHLYNLNKGLAVYLKSYGNILIMGDLNSEATENCLNDFCKIYSLKTLLRDPKCFKIPNNLLWIVLFLTNQPKGFQLKCNHEKKIHYNKQKAKTIQYRNYLFRSQLILSWTISC